MTQRLIDVNGEVIVHPPEYHTALKAVRDLIDTMERDNVDRSDMAVILQNLGFEARFHLQFLPNRSKQQCVNPTES